MATDHSQVSAVFDAHMQAELAADLDATMETMAEFPHLINLGSGTDVWVRKVFVAFTLRN